MPDYDDLRPEEDGIATSENCEKSGQVVPDPRVIGADFMVHSLATTPYAHDDNFMCTTERVK